MIGRTYSAIGAAIPHRTEAEREQAIADLDRLVSSDRILVPITGQYAFEETPKMIARLGCDIMGRHIINIYTFNLPGTGPSWCFQFNYNLSLWARLSPKIVNFRRLPPPTY